MRIIANDNQITTFAGDLVSAAANYGVPDNYSWGNYSNYLKRMDGQVVVSVHGHHHHRR